MMDILNYMKFYGLAGYGIDWESIPRKVPYKNFKPLKITF